MNKFLNPTLMISATLLLLAVSSTSFAKENPKETEAVVVAEGCADCNVNASTRGILATKAGNTRYDSLLNDDTRSDGPANGKDTDATK